MPFTLSHTAAVLPLLHKKKSPWNSTALILGSMAPDFEYFLHLQPFSQHGHSLAGQLFFNLPLVLLGALWFHHLVKVPLISHLPESLCSRLQPLLWNRERLETGKEWFSFIYSALLGMATHLLWDRITHRSADFLLLMQPVNWRTLSFPLYSLIQHISSLTGLFFLIGYLLKLAPAKGILLEASPGKKWTFWLETSLVTLLFWSVFLWLRLDFRLGSLIVSLISSGFIALSIMALLPRSLSLYKIRRHLLKFKTAAGRALSYKSSSRRTTA